jgi:hypothetical protein
MEMKCPLVLVEWEDAFSTDEWTDLDQLERGCLSCVTVGFLVHRSKKTLIVAGTVSKDGQGCCVMHIPARWVKRVQKLPGGGEYVG